MLVHTNLQMCHLAQSLTDGIPHGGLVVADEVVAQHAAFARKESGVWVGCRDRLGAWLVGQGVG